MAIHTQQSEYRLKIIMEYMADSAIQVNEYELDLPMIGIWHISNLTGITMRDLLHDDFPSMCKHLEMAAVFEQVNEGTPMMFPKIGFIRINRIKGTP